MSSVLEGMKIAVIGGDDRELYLILRLREMGAEIRVAGLPIQKTEGVTVCQSVKEAVQQAKVIILPMPGTDNAGKVRAVHSKEPVFLTGEVLQEIGRDALLFIGSAKPFLKSAAERFGFKLIEIADIDEVAIYNSIPSAEGAIQMAMAGSPVTVHGSNSIVLGMGRCGFTLARMLSALGAKVSAAARKPSDLARAFEMGWQPVTYQELPDMVGEADFIYNTVPQLVITRELLTRVNTDAYIIDLASAPGGVDYKAAEEFGIRADLAPGLPGKVAPKTAGHILAKVIPDLIKRELLLASPGCKY